MWRLPLATTRGASGHRHSVGLEADLSDRALIVGAAHVCVRTALSNTRTPWVYAGVPHGTPGEGATDPASSTVQKIINRQDLAAVRRIGTHPGRARSWWSALAQAISVHIRAH